MDYFDDELAASINAVLPQTQCTKCGYAGCRPYAEALARGAADLNQCSPGGDAGIRKIAMILNKPHRPLNPAYGNESPLAIALIDEALCIGCTLCIQACPVDAIVGGPRHMHTVISEQCTGCELCVPPCPVDCITMTLVRGPDAAWGSDRADSARRRHEQRQLRRSIAQEQHIGRVVARAQDPDQKTRPKLQFIQAAIERARMQRSSPGKAPHVADRASRTGNGSVKET